MKKLSFDQRGYLQPYESIEIDLETFEYYFVKAFPKSETRDRLFDNYLRFLYKFQDEIFPFFEQWINGSFVTQKENPNDIDFVTFLDFDIWELKPEKKLDEFWTFSLEEEGLDSYLVKRFPEEHELFGDYSELNGIWKNRYSYPENNAYPKGFLKIIFEK